jgi:hypothetical protein
MFTVMVPLDGTREVKEALLLELLSVFTSTVELPTANLVVLLEVPLLEA